MQECYLSKTREAGKRARQLRKAGFNVVTESLGYQIIKDWDNEYTVKLTMVTILDDGRAIPAPDFEVTPYR